MKQNIKVLIEYLSGLCLENAGNKIEYTDEDLSNAVIIFQEVFSNKLYDFNKDKTSQEQLFKLGKKSGKSIRDTVLLFTGVDLHKVYEKN